MAGVDYIISLKDNFTKTLRKVNVGLTQTNKKVESLNKSISGTNVAIGLMATAFASVKVLKIAGEFEQAQIAFETMLGSAEKGQKVLKDITDFAAKTPFSIKGVQTNAKLLLAVGIEAENLLPTMKALGDVSAGLNVPLERLALNFGQIKSLGRLTGRELRDFTTAGVPIIAELTKNLGKSEQQIFEMVSAGKIGFKDVEKAFQTMTGEGGKFNNLMTRLNKTFLGQVNELTEQLQLLGKEVGDVLMPVIRPLIQQLSKVVQWMQQNRILVRFLVKTIGTLIVGIGGLVLAIKAWAAIQAVINVLLTANPIGLIVAGVAALVAGVYFAVEAFREWVKENETLYRTINGIKQVLNDTWNVVKPFFMFIWGTGLMVFKGLSKVLFFIGKTVLKSIVRPFKIAFQSIKRLINLASKIPIVAKFFDKVKSSFDKGFTSPIKEASKIAKTNGSNVLGGLSSVVSGETQNASKGQTTKVTSSAPKVFNINIDKLVESFKVETTNITEGAEKTKEMITEALLSALADIKTR